MWIHRWLLRLYPRQFRRHYGAEILRVIGERRSAAAEQGFAALARFHLGALRDALENAVAERTRVKVHQPSGMRWPSAFLLDARHAARTLRRTPSLTVLTALTLALGIGSVTAVASLVDAVLLQPLPFPKPADVVSLRGVVNGDPTGLSIENLRDLGEGARGLRAWSPFFAQSVNLTGVQEPDRLRGGFVTSGFFEIVGAVAARGRTFGREADVPNGERVAVLTDTAWRLRFGARTDIVGSAIQLNNESFTVVGILPASFSFPVDAAEVYLPVWATTAGTSRDNHNYMAIARLAAGSTRAEAEAEVRSIAARLEAAYPETNRGRSVRLDGFQDVLTADLTDSIRLLAVMAILMLLAGCANAAGLQLGALVTRRREIAVRAAIGAGRLRIASQILLESVARASLGAVLGLIVAQGVIRLLVMRAPQNLYGIERAGMSTLTLLVGLLAALVAGVSAGIPAAVGLGREGGVAAIGSGDRLAGDRRSSRLRRVVVISQVAVAALLLVGAGLTTRSFQRLSSVDVGFEPSHLLTMEYRVPRNKYPTAQAQQAFHDRVLASVGAVPGVIGAAGVRALPFSGNGSFAGYRVEGRNEQARASFNAVSLDYFSLMRIPLQSGRVFGPGDHSTLVVVVSRSLADREWPDGSALGRRLQFDSALSATVIGIVGDVRHRELGETSLAAVYTLQAQNPSVFNTLVVRTAAEPTALAADVRRAVWAVDPDQPVWKVRALDAMIDQSLATRRFLLQLVTFTGLSAAIVALLGLYAIVAASVAQRTREVGVRVALGATPLSVLRLVLSSGFRLAAAGIAIGLTVALATSRVLEQYLFGITSRDPVSFAGAGLVLATATIVACVVPALRALRVDPVQALRT